MNEIEYYFQTERGGPVSSLYAPSLSFAIRKAIAKQGKFGWWSIRQKLEFYERATYYTEAGRTLASSEAGVVSLSVDILDEMLERLIGDIN